MRRMVYGLAAMLWASLGVAPASCAVLLRPGTELSPRKLPTSAPKPRPSASLVSWRGKVQAGLRSDDGGLGGGARRAEVAL
jgi:hypothetical protein